MTEREAWMWMLANAAYKDTRHRVGSELFDVPRGSFMATLREMQSAFMWKSDKRVRTFLKTLEKEAMIGRTVVGTANAPKTHVTICKYEEYQSRGRTKDAPQTHDGTHHGRTTDAVKQQGNKVTTEEEAKASLSPLVPKPKKPSPTGSRISEDWKLSKPLGDWAMSEGASMEMVRTQADQFKDYWIGVAGAKARKADWDATWRNWIRKAITDSKPRLRAINGGSNDKPASKSKTHMDAFIGGARG